MVKGRHLLTCLAAVLTLVAFQGCEDKEVVRPDTNRPPETSLTVAPNVSDRVFHKYPVHWAGLDRDGVVVAYRVASLPEDALYGDPRITTVEARRQYFIDQEQAYLAEGREFWTVTSATESLFVFTADKPNSRNHSLYVAAIDNEGKPDPTPAATNFLAIDFGIPDIEVCIRTTLDPDTCSVPSAKGDTLPADEPYTVKLEWEGTDSDGSIREWRYRLDSSPDSTVAPDVLFREYVYDPIHPSPSNLGVGFHEFRLVAIDDAGAKSNESITRFVINYDPDTYIDSVWTFRRPPPSGPHLPVPERLIYPFEPGKDTIRVAYHFGALRFKFHGADIDGAPPDSFRWNVRGTLIQSRNPIDSKSPWIGCQSFCGACDSLFCDEFPSNAPNLDTDSPLTFFIRAKDRLGKVDGSPDTIVFEINHGPRIDPASFGWQVISPGTVKFTWDCSDPDQDIGRGASTEQALVLYKYKVDDADWVQVTTKSANLYVKNCTVTGLGPGPHTFRLHAYNGVYQLTRADMKEWGFSLP